MVRESPQYTPSSPAYFFAVRYPASSSVLCTASHPSGRESCDTGPSFTRPVARCTGMDITRPACKPPALRSRLAPVLSVTSPYWQQTVTNRPAKPCFSASRYAAKSFRSSPSRGRRVSILKYVGRCRFHSSSALVCAAVQSTESVSPAIWTNSTSYRASGLSRASITSMMDGVGASRRHS